MIKNLSLLIVVFAAFSACGEPTEEVCSKKVGDVVTITLLEKVTTERSDPISFLNDVTCDGIQDTIVFRVSFPADVSIPTKYRKFDTSLGYTRVLYSLPAGVVLKVVITEKLSDHSYKADVLEILS